MNKSLLTLVFVILLIPLPALAEMHGNVEFGCDTVKMLQYANVNIAYQWQPLIFDHIIYGGVRTYLYIENWQPLQMVNNTFTIGTMLRYKDIYFKINHFCTHSTGTDFWTAPMWDKYFWNDSGTQISIGIEW